MRHCRSLERWPLRDISPAASAPPSILSASGRPFNPPASVGSSSAPVMALIGSPFPLVVHSTARCSFSHPRSSPPLASLRGREFSAHCLPNDDGKVVVSGEKGAIRTVVLLGWMGGEMKYLKKYAEIYNSKGFRTVTFVVPAEDLLSLIMPARRSLEERVARLVGELAVWCSEAEKEGRESYLLFHTLSNGGWLTYGLVLEELQSSPDIIGKIKGCIFDSAPATDMSSPQGWALAIYKTLMEKSRSLSKTFAKDKSAAKVDDRLDALKNKDTRASLSEVLSLLVMFFKNILMSPENDHCGLVIQDSQDTPDIVGTVKGCIVDSAPAMDMTTPQSWAPAIYANLLRKSGSLINTLAQDKVNEKLDTLKHKDASDSFSEVLSLLEMFFTEILMLPGCNQRMKNIISTLSNKQPVYPQLYLYSSADELIPVSSVENFIKEQKSLGRDVSAHDFGSSGHVRHFMKYPEAYSAKLDEFLEAAFQSPQHS